MQKRSGKFIVSLDFEIMWGVRDLVTIESYGAELRGVRDVIPEMLKAFTNYGIRSTFAVVGFLFFKDKQELLSNLPAEKPSYENKNLSPYGDYLEKVGQNYDEDFYHYGWPLIEQIRNTPGQEIGTHTFSHYYCLEKGQNISQFKNDLDSAIGIAEKRGIKLTSIIFPRNQFNEEYIKVCRDRGIIAYRNNEKSWLYAARSFTEETSLRRALRLMDAYINITGNHAFDIENRETNSAVNVPSSRFLRPYTHGLRFFEGLRLARIKNSMTHAAKNGLSFHLWWHPHNFGTNQRENFSFLEKILQHYKHLNNKYNFQSCTMTEFANEILSRK